MAKAPIGKRVIAYLIDAAITMGIVMILGIGSMVAIMVLTMLLAAITRGVGALIGFLAIPAYLLALLLGVGYMLLRDSLNGGRSFGKKFMGLKVVKGSAPCSRKDSLLRNITLAIPLLNLIDLIMPFVDAEGMRFGDKIAGTQVVEA